MSSIAAPTAVVGVAVAEPIVAIAHATSIDATAATTKVDAQTTTTITVGAMDLEPLAESESLVGAAIVPDAVDRNGAAVAGVTPSAVADGSKATTADAAALDVTATAAAAMTAAGNEMAASKSTTVTTAEHRNYTQIDSPKTNAIAVAAEEDDHLSPLMMDNHTVTEHQEIFKPAAAPVASNGIPSLGSIGSASGFSTSITSICSNASTSSSIRLQDMADRVHEIPEFRPMAATVAAAAAAAVASVQSMGGSVDSDKTTMEMAQQRQSDGDSGCDVASSSDGSGSANDAGGHSNGHQLRRGSNNSSADDGDVAGDDAALPPIELPSAELSAQIMEQVQFYFSNDNILKDAFLLKHVRRNKEGFVSLKLISSFKRVRQLTKDWRVVGVAIRSMQLAATGSGGDSAPAIELNEAGTKVRRLEALPVFDETMPSRTVVAADLPVERLTIESVSVVFKKCGEIALIRILRPGGTIPADVRQFYNKHPELHEKECALVEFTESTAARRALDLEGMLTFEMVAPKKKTGKKAAPGAGGAHPMGGGYASANVARIVSDYRYPSYADVERSRGGGGGEDYRYAMRRGSAGYFVKYLPEQQQQQQAERGGFYRRTSYGNTAAINVAGAELVDHANGVATTQQFITRRLSNCSIGSSGDLMMRKISNCSDGYCGSTDAASRRPSGCSQDSTRRVSQCSAMGGVVPDGVYGRRASQCSQEYCVCQRRPSQPQPMQPQQQFVDQMYVRRGTGCAEHVGYHNQQQQHPQQQQRYISAGGQRRISFDGEFGKTLPFGGIERKISGGFEAMRKLSTDKFYEARKMSADSGYDRRSSVGSALSEHRGSIGGGVPTSVAATVAGMKADACVRTPIGPDGSKGFGSRARKVGAVVGLV